MTAPQMHAVAPLTLQAELTAALADSSSLAAELEGAYVMLGEAQGEIYALRDQVGG